jgi:hypothetical protein
MSSPKYTAPPPPMYSKEVLQGALHASIQASARLEIARSALAAAEVTDAKGRASLRGEELLASIASEIEKALQPVTLNLPVSFGETERRAAEQTLRAHAEKAGKLCAVIAAGERQLEELRTDLKAHDRVLAHHAVCDAAVHRHVGAMADQLRANATKETQKEIDATLVELTAVSLAAKPPAFALGFRNNESPAIRTLDGACGAAEQRISGIVATLDRKLSNIHAFKDGIPRPYAPQVPAEDLKARAAARDAAMRTIDGCPDAVLKREFLAEVERLDRATVQRDPFFLQQLGQRAADATQTYRNRERGNALVQQMSAVDVHPGAQREHEMYLASLERFQNDRSARQSLLEDLQGRAAAWERASKAAAEASKAAAEASKAAAEAGLVRDREQRFFRDQLVASLKVRGYEPEEASLRYDAATASDVLLQNPHGGAVRVIFEPDEVRFNYYTMEKPDSSRAQAFAQRAMDTACSDVKAAIEAVRSLGVPLKPLTEIEGASHSPLVMPEPMKKRLVRPTNHLHGSTSNAAKSRTE